ncbi:MULTISPECIES: DNRLRE domain-containing protein [unclassified Streptomyces]|uniref:DNRLRE domain-containing protein n=1 Tax=unclassified Streptomyces TaxID=2593676 RepID=UPI00225AEDA1|nr:MULTISPECIES: DNRLRE domain-containing protein [unclassified Streptomyces]MCX4991696.1 DNRLRE domain-containing protein [Streptomyces sp. NBC_00568]MCX5003068.1 DNRLRE domain-containing protein [Streptomyces sp. NBC_00638]
MPGRRADGPPADVRLLDPALEYPVTIDPTDSLLGPVTDTWVQYDDHLTSQRGSTELKAGTYNGTEKARSYLKFDVAKYAGKHILDTDLRLYSYYSPTCSTSGAGNQVRRITSAWDSSAITWAEQPTTTSTGAVTSTAAKGYNSSCPAGHVPGHRRDPPSLGRWPAELRCADRGRRRDGPADLAPLLLGEPD